MAAIAEKVSLHTDTISPEASKAKDTLVKHAERVNKQLYAYFENILANPFNVSSDQLELNTHILKHIKEHNLRKAKRARATFIFFGYGLFADKNNGKVVNEEAIIRASLGIEIVHTALLMHDDKMDQDTTRRGLPTTHVFYEDVHRKKYSNGDPAFYGDNMAVDVGDAALMLGFNTILDENSFPPEARIKATTRMLTGIANTAFGQAYDLTLGAKGKATEKNIIALHHAKTAIYTYENPLHTGALLGGATEKDLKLLSEYAIPGGIAFQLQDDILGLFGDPEKTGKPAHSDLRQRKTTALIIKALENASPKQARRIKEIWGKDDLTEEEAEEVRQIVINTGSLDYSKKIAKEWARKAQEAIPKMRKKGWDTESIDFLNGIAQYMIERDL